MCPNTKWLIADSLCIASQLPLDWSMGLTSAQAGWSSAMVTIGLQRITLTGEWTKLQWCAERCIVEILSGPRGHSVKAPQWEGIRSAVVVKRALSHSARRENMSGRTTNALERQLSNVQVRLEVELKIVFWVNREWSNVTNYILLPAVITLGQSNYRTHIDVNAAMQTNVPKTRAKQKCP